MTDRGLSCIALGTKKKLLNATQISGTRDVSYTRCLLENGQRHRPNEGLKTEYSSAGMCPEKLPALFKSTDNDLKIHYMVYARRKPQDYTGHRHYAAGTEQGPRRYGTDTHTGSMLIIKTHTELFFVAPVPRTEARPVSSI